MVLAASPPTLGHISVPDYQCPCFACGQLTSFIAHDVKCGLAQLGYSWPERAHGDAVHRGGLEGVVAYVAKTSPVQRQRVLAVWLLGPIGFEHPKYLLDGLFTRHSLPAIHPQWT